jgi:hypothetical protein
MTLNNRRFALRWLRKLFDVLEERLYAEEVKLRNDLSGRELVPGVAASSPEKPVIRKDMPHQRAGPARGRKRGCTASAFDLRFSS